MFPPEPPAYPEPWRPEQPQPPKGAQAVTIVAGFVLDDGLLFAADSRHSTTATQMQSTKIFTETRYRSGLRSVFALCGDVQACKMLIQDCEEALENLKNPEIQNVRKTIRNTIIHTYRSHFFPPDPPGAQLLIGVHCRGKKDERTLFMLNTHTRFNSLRSYDAIGSGAYPLGHYLVRAKYQALKARGAHSLDAVFQIAVEAIAVVKEWDPYCGKATEFVWLRENGALIRAQLAEDKASAWAKVLARLKGR